MIPVEIPLVVSLIALAVSVWALERAWPCRKHTLDPELHVLFEEFRKDRTVVHACVELSTKKTLHVIEAENPRLTPEKARHYQVLAALIRDKGWRVEGVPVMPPKENK